MRLPRAMLVLVTLSACASACSTILGLGDFTNGQPDASAGSGGNAGAAGSAGSGGAAGTAGAGGTAGGDSGPTTSNCKNVGAPVELDAADAGTVTNDHGLWLAEDLSEKRIFVIMATNAGMVVRVLGNSNPLQLGNPTSVPAVTGIPSGALVGSGTLDVYTDDLQHVHFTFGGGTTPDLTFGSATAVSKPCPSGDHPGEAHYSFDANKKVHWAVTCVSGSDAGTAEVVVDGTAWTGLTGPPADAQDRLEVQDYMYLGANQGVLVLGNNHNLLDIDNGGAKTFNIAGSDAGTSQSLELSVWKPSSTELGFSGALLHFVNGSPKTGDLYTGVMQSTDIDKLLTDPKSVLHDVALYSSLSKGVGPAPLSEDTSSLWAASTSISGTSVQMLRLSPANGQLQSPVHVVVDTSGGGDTESEAVAAPFSNSFGVTGVVVWIQNGAGTSKVYGQLVSCTS